MRFSASISGRRGRAPDARGNRLFRSRHPRRPGRPRCLTGLIALLGALAALSIAAGPAAANQLLYYGGPVVHSANVILVKWGPDVRASYTDPATGDPGFLNYLAGQNGSTSDIGGVLAQYMDTTGHNSQNAFSFGGTVQIDPAVAPTPPGKVVDSQIQAALTKAIGAGTLPRPAGKGLSTVYVVLFPPGDNVCFDNGGGCAYSGFCAYHGSFQLNGSSTQILYAAMVDNGPGTPNAGACGVGVNSDVGNQTSVVSHELSESINDPLDAVTSWYDYADNGEIADRCDGEPAGANGPWTVERLWSDRDRKCQAGESAFQAPTARFLASSTGNAGQAISFDANASSDPASNSDSALNQNNKKTYSLSSGIVSYRWNWGDGTTTSAGGGASVKHVFATSGNYQVSLTVTDRLGFTSTKTQQVSIGGGTPGTPIVTTGPASALSNQGATLNGTINPQGQSVSYQFLWGTSAGALDNRTPLTSGPAGQSAVPVSATLTGLSPSTTYYFQLLVTVGSHAPYTGSVHRFTTTSSTPRPQTPVVGTGPAERVSASGALLTGTINPGGSSPVRYAFHYGTSAQSLGQTTTQSTQPGGTTASLVSATITGLSRNTTYYFRLIVTFQGRDYLGAIRSFTTSGPLPGVQTEGASHIAGDSAVLSGAINPHGSSTIYQVQFGLTPQYGHSSTWIQGGSGTSFQVQQIVVFGLTPGTTYHYRFVAQNRFGTAVGADRTFTTATRARSAPRFRLRVVSQLPWRRVLTHRLRVHFDCSTSCRARFVVLAVRAGQARSVTLPLAVGRGAATLPRGGAGQVHLSLSPRFRRQLQRTGSGGQLELELVAYASSGNSGPSAPQQATVKLTQ